MNFFKGFKDNLIPTILFAFMISVFGPMEVYLSNKGYFFFPGTDMLGMIMVVFALIITISFGVLGVSQVIGDVFYKVIYGMFIGGIIGLYIQGNWDITDYGAWNGSDIEWTDFRVQFIGFALMWIVLFILCVFLSCKKYDIFKKASQYICGFILLILLYTLIVLLVRNSGLGKDEEYIATTDHELQLSSSQNMIILVVDTFDGTAFNDIITNNPEYSDIFGGFTFYRDTMSAYTSTDMSIPMIMTGNDYRNDITYGEYLCSSYSDSELMQWLSENEWGIGVYTDMLVPQNNDELGIENLHKLLRVSSDRVTLMRYMYDIILFRYLPQPLKRYFTFYPDNLKTELCTFASSDYNVYTEDNLLFEDAVKYISAKRPEGVFQLIHIDGSHPPFYYTSDLVLSDNETSYEEECEGIIKLINQFIAGLKDKGVYDNTVILIMGDHGYYNSRQNPLLLVKATNETHALEISEKPVSFYDLQDAYLKLLEGKSDSRSVFDDVAVEGRTRTIRSVPWNTHLNHDTYGGLMKEYATDKTAYDPNGLGFDGNEYAPVDNGGLR